MTRKKVHGHKGSKGKTEEEAHGKVVGASVDEGDICKPPAREGPTIDASKLDFDFKYEIQKQPGGEKITTCFQCGSCSAVCAVGAVDPSYDPRKIIRMSLLGLRDEVLKSEFIWLCTSCYICHERCPQGVSITDLIGAIQTIAIKEGHIHPLVSTGMKLLEKHGRMIEIGSFENKIRKKMALPEIKERHGGIRKILKRAEVQDLLLKKAKEGS